MEPKALLSILHQAEKLKCITRHCDTTSGRRESVAEHSWRLALMAMLAVVSFSLSKLNKKMPEIEAKIAADNAETV